MQSSVLRCEKTVHPHQLQYYGMAHSHRQRGHCTVHTLSVSIETTTSDADGYEINVTYLPVSQSLYLNSVYMYMHGHRHNTDMHAITLKNTHFTHFTHCPCFCARPIWCSSAVWCCSISEAEQSTTFYQPPPHF